MKRDKQGRFAKEHQYITAIRVLDTKNINLLVHLGYVHWDAIKPVKKPKTKVIEAVVKSCSCHPNVFYGKYKLVVKQDGILRECAYPQAYGMDKCYFVTSSARGGYDFATPEERVRFENVKREVERKGEKFEGEYFGERPPGMIAVYAGEYRYPKRNEPRVDSGIAYVNAPLTEYKSLRTILRLVPDPNYKETVTPPDKCDSCACTYTPKPAAPKFEPGDWVVDTNGCPFPYHPDICVSPSLRHARRTDFETSLGATRVWMQDEGNNLTTTMTSTDGSIWCFRNDVAKSVAEKLGVTIMPADFTEKG